MFSILGVLKKKNTNKVLPLSFDIYILHTHTHIIYITKKCYRAHENLNINYIYKKKIYLIQFWLDML